MAKELIFAWDTGKTCYVSLLNSVGQWYNTVLVGFEAFNAANFTDYDIAATEFGTSGMYAADMPGVAVGVYNIQSRERAGGSPAQSDLVIGVGEILWSGSAVIFPPANFATLSVDGFGRIDLGSIRSRLLPAEISGGNYGNSFVSVFGQANDEAPEVLADALIARNIAGGSNTGRTVKTALASLRNKVAFDVPAAGQFSVYDTDDTTVLWTGTYVASPVDPVTSITPSA